MLPGNIPDAPPNVRACPDFRDWDFWTWLLLPLCIGVAVVYKSIKCRRMKQVPREAAGIAVSLLAGLAGTAVILITIAKLIDRSRS